MAPFPGGFRGVRAGQRRLPRRSRFRRGFRAGWRRGGLWHRELLLERAGGHGVLLYFPRRDSGLFFPTSGRNVEKSERRCTSAARREGRAGLHRRPRPEWSAPGGRNRVTAGNAGLQTGTRGAPHRARRNPDRPHDVYGLDRRPPVGIARKRETSGNDAAACRSEGQNSASKTRGVTQLSKFAQWSNRAGLDRDHEARLLKLPTGTTTSCDHSPVQNPSEGRFCPVFPLLTVNALASRIVLWER